MECGLHPGFLFMLNVRILVTVVGGVQGCRSTVPPPYSQTVQKRYASRGACVFVCVCVCVCVEGERE